MPVNQYSLNGAAFLYVGAAGGPFGPPGPPPQPPLNQFALLGYTEQGVDLVLSEAKEEIMTDLLGTKTPQDFQNMGVLAQIVAPMIAFDSVQMNSLITFTDALTLGEIGTPGMVYGVNGIYFSLYITGLFQPPWYFPYCLLRQEGTRLATKVNPFRLEIVAWPFLPFTATSATNAVLFQRAVT